MAGAENVEKKFDELIQRLREGDGQAANELVCHYEPEVRRYVRFRLTSPSIRRFVDSLDISQSVLGRFFVQYQQGAIEIDSEAQLRNLLLTMARNKLYDHARKQQAAKRDVRRVDTDAAEAVNEAVDPTDTPNEQLAASELVSAIRAKLTDEEKYVVEQRFDGRAWDDLAAEVNSTPEALRKRTSRAIDRIARELGVLEQ